MKKRTKVVIAAASIVTVLILLPFAAFMIRMTYESSSMKALDTAKVVDGVYAVRDDYVNMYVVKKQADIVAIDAVQDADVAKKEVAKIGIDPAAVKAVFLTHTDYDHAGAITLFQNARVYISAAEEQMVNGKINRSLIFKNKLDVPHQLMRDGDEVIVGGIKIRGILTPGHTPGSMCFVVDNAYLFTGDTISLVDGKAAHFNEFFNMDTPREKESILVLKNLRGIQYIFTAHYGFSGDFEKSFRDYKN